MISNLAVEQREEIRQQWEAEADFKEYMSAVNPSMPKIDVVAFPASIHQEGPTKVTAFDLSNILETAYPATTPNLMANFVRICNGEALSTKAKATSQMFYVISGTGRTQMSDGSGTIEWKQGDLFTLPAIEEALHTATKDVALYWVHDAPLIQYLGALPNVKRFEPVLYTKERLEDELMKVRSEGTHRNRTGVLLANPNFPNTMTLTHTLWSLYNSLPAGVEQKPHRHNSVALDFCVAAGSDTYTLIAKEIDNEGNLIDPIKAHWEPGALFITPPGWWHSHHNHSDQDAIVLPIQDAGLIMNMQVLDFQYID